MEKRLYRSRTDRMLGGVCGGLGSYFGVDPSLVRLAMLLLIFFGGAGPLLYFILWIILPEEGRTYASPEETARANAQDIANRARQFGDEMKTAFSGSSATSQEGQSAPTDLPAGSLLPESKPASAAPANGARVFGLILVAAGVMFLLSNLIPNFLTFRQWWPIILVLIGAAMLYGQFRK